MALFNVTFYDKEKNLKTLDFEQPNEEAVIIFLKRQGIVPVSIKPAKAKSKLAVLNFGKISLLEKETMTRHLGILIKIGTPLVESVQLLIEGTKNPKLLAVYREMVKALEEGRLFSSVFEKYPKEFNQSFTAVVRVGEMSGTLDQALTLLSLELGRQRELSKKIRSVLIYPIILTFSVSGLLLVIILFVMPRIASVFSSYGTDLPVLTRVLINLSNFLRKNLILNMILFVILPIGGLVTFATSAAGRKGIQKILTVVPGVRKLITQIRLAHISRELNTMLKAGLPLTQSLETAAEGFSGTPYRDALNEISKDVQKGITLTDSMKKRKNLFPGMFVGMMRIGERTATLDDVLNYMAEFYETETSQTLQTLSTLIEPALLIVIGVIVLLISLSVLVPIYRLVGQII